MQRPPRTDEEKMSKASASPTIARLAFEKLEPALAAALAPRYRRLGYLGEFFRCMGHRPVALRSFIELTEDAKAALDKRTVEVIALTIAAASGNAYELNQHERLCIRSGFEREWVRQVEALTPQQGAALSPEDHSTQSWVLAIVKGNFAAARAAHSAFAAQVGAEKAVAALFVVGRYIAHSAMVQTLGLAPPVPSIFEDGFDGD
jgi:alkylhydroperoxidase/carboxymuconolactone decarboxylase family protein YurZ